VLDLTGKGFHDSEPSTPVTRHAPAYQMTRPVFAAVLRGNFVVLSSQSWASDLHVREIWGGNSQSLALTKHLLDFRYTASLRNQNALKSPGVETRSQISHFSPSAKANGWVDEVSDSIFQAQPVTQTVIYFWCGAAERAGYLTHFAARFQVAILQTLILRVSGDLYQIYGGDRLIICAPNVRFRL